MRIHLLAIMTLTAVAGAGASTVSLDSCRRMAVANNKSLQIAEENIRGAAYYRKAAFSAYLPSVDFTGTYFYNKPKIEHLGEAAKLPTMSIDPASGKYNYNIVTGPDGVPVKDPATGSYIPSEVAVIPKEAMSYDVHNVFAGAFTLTQPIYMGGQIRALNEIAGLTEKVAKSSRNALAQDIVYAVDDAYWQVVSLRQKKRLAESFASLVDSLLHDVRAMYDEGVATRSDVLTVEVKQNEAQIALVKVDNGLTLSRMALAQICGLPVNTVMTLSDEGLQSVATAPAPADYNMADVYARRQDLEVIRTSISLMRSREKMAIGEMLPKIALVGAYSFSNPNVNHGFEKKFGGGFNVGATLTVPLWHWGGRYNRYKAAKSATIANRLLLEDAQEKVDLQVSQARFSYEEAFKTYAMTLTNMKKADENLRQAELGFKEGVLTSDDVLRAQTAWIQAHSEKIDAEIGIRLCEVYLSKVLGELSY